MAPNERKAALTVELARARDRIGVNLGALRHDLDFSTRLKQAVIKKPAAWVGGATLFGLLLSKLPARKKKIVVRADGKPVKVTSAGKTGLLLAGFKMAFDVARPALMRWARQRVTEQFDGTGKNRRVSP